MKNIGDLHYLSFSAAKLLEMTGYNEECLVAYRYNNDSKNTSPELISLGAPKKNIHLKEYSTVGTLTYDEAIEYIMNKYNFYIACYPRIILSSITGKVRGVSWDAKIAKLNIGWRTTVAENEDYYTAIDDAIQSFFYNYVLTDKDKELLSNNEWFKFIQQEWELNKTDYEDIRITP